MSSEEECDFKHERSPCSPPPSSLFFSSSIAFILASWTSARALHSFLLLFSPSNMGVISVWKRENSCRHADTRVSADANIQRNTRVLTIKKRGRNRGGMRKVTGKSRYLVHKGADKVDETTLHLRQLVRMISVHHWLKREEAGYDDYCYSFITYSVGNRV